MYVAPKIFSVYFLLHAYTMPVIYVFSFTCVYYVNIYKHNVYSLANVFCKFLHAFVHVSLDVMDE